MTSSKPFNDNVSSSRTNSSEYKPSLKKIRKIEGCDWRRIQGLKMNLRKVDEVLILIKNNTDTTFEQTKPRTQEIFLKYLTKSRSSFSLNTPLE